MNTPSLAKPNRLPWIIAGIAVLAMVATMVYSRGGTQRKAGDDDTLQRIAERLDRLEERDAGTLRPRGDASMGAAPGMVSGADRMASMMEERQRTPAELEAERDRQYRELEAQFARDAADPVGGGKTEATLEKTLADEAMASTGLEPKDVDIACKKNSCRITGSFAKRGDAEDWGLFYITAAGGNVLSRTRMVYMPQPDGSVQVRIYSERAKG